VAQLPKPLKTRQAFSPSHGRKVIEPLKQRHPVLIFLKEEDVNVRQWSSSMFSLLVTVVKLTRQPWSGIVRPH